MMRHALANVSVAGLLLTALLVPLASSAGAQDKVPPQDEHPDWGANVWQAPPAGWNLKNMAPAQRQRMARSWAFMNKQVPEDYLEAENTVGFTIAAIAAGGPLYAAHCARCHGATGLGNGDLAPDLNPSPALLAYLVQQPIAGDQYLLWSIDEGGKQFNTAMPAFKTELTREQIWQIVAYLRAGFPALESETPESGVEPPVKTDEPPPKP
jgi:mono/diheme cytochrome c family protein